MAHRVTVIQEALPQTRWRHVPTDENPADIASRGATASTLLESELWWYVPPWLRLPPTQWPAQPAKPNPEPPPEIKTVLRVSVVDSSELWGRYSDLRKLVRVVAGIIRFLTHCREGKSHKQLCLSQQQMGRLPEVRVNPALPFHHTGVDLAGPFLCETSYARKSSTIKNYACVIVCMATKAIHLEMLSDLSTGSFLAYLSRFTARCGTPAIIHSDNGTNFVGANRELCDIYHLIQEAGKLRMS